jgi:hypothetical protein
MTATSNAFKDIVPLLAPSCCVRDRHERRRPIHVCRPLEGMERSRAEKGCALARLSRESPMSSPEQIHPRTPVILPPATSRSLISWNRRRKPKSVVGPPILPTRCKCGKFRQGSTAPKPLLGTGSLSTGFKSTPVSSTCAPWRPCVPFQKFLSGVFPGGVRLGVALATGQLWEAFHKLSIC